MLHAAYKNIRELGKNAYNSYRAAVTESSVRAYDELGPLQVGNSEAKADVTAYIPVWNDHMTSSAWQQLECNLSSGANERFHFLQIWRPKQQR